jgi:hypothetical protein
MDMRMDMWGMLVDALHVGTGSQKVQEAIGLAKYEHVCKDYRD